MAALNIFGVRPVIEAIEADKQIERVYVRRDSDSPLIQQIRDLCASKRVAIQNVPVQKLDRLTRNNHQGVVALMSAIEYSDINEIMDEVEESGETPLVVLLDSVTDIRNFGGIARSAECAGAHAIILPLKNSAPVNAEAIKSSAGALNIIPICRVGSIRNTLKTLSVRGMQIVAATEKSEKPIYQADMTKPTVIVMGSEDMGISKEVLKMCDENLSIPLKGNIESLNVSAAAAVILFEVVRQRG